MNNDLPPSWKFEEVVTINCEFSLFGLIWLSGRAVKTQLQIVLIRLFAATPIREFLYIYIYILFKKNFFKFIFNTNWISIRCANSLISTICS